MAPLRGLASTTARAPSASPAAAARGVASSVLRCQGERPAAARPVRAAANDADADARAAVADTDAPWRTTATNGHHHAAPAPASPPPPSATRRAALAAAAASLAASLALARSPPPAAAVQGLTAGRIPGLGTTLDEYGYAQYKRPEGKSGGHGVGWSEVPRYSFRVPSGWEETPVSIADLGGTGE